MNAKRRNQERNFIYRYDNCTAKQKKTKNNTHNEWKSVRCRQSIAGKTNTPNSMQNKKLT